MSPHLIVMALVRCVCTLLIEVEDGHCGASWMTRETTNPPALGMPSCVGKEMWEGGSVLGEALCQGGCLCARPLVEPTDLLVGVSDFLALVSCSVADTVVRGWGFHCWRVRMKYSGGRSIH